MKKIFALVLLISLFTCKKDLIEDFENENKTVKKQFSEGENEMPIVYSPFPHCTKSLNPIGGGVGYNDIIQILGPNDIMISSPISALDFKSTIEHAVPGTVIFIDPNLTIDLTNFYSQTNSGSIFVPDGVTIASNRGQYGSLGALILTNDVIDEYTWNHGSSQQTILRQPIFKISGDNVRITGLRLQGPTADVWGPSTNATNDRIFFKLGIQIDNNHENLEIDNCDIYAWPEAGITIGRGYSSGSFNNNYIHNNYIHKNRCAGFGYGIKIDYGFAKISSNIFESNRHDIAATGRKDIGYEASCNTVMQAEVVENSANQHNFDMHEEGGAGATNAGKFVFIHHNDFLYTLNKNIGICARPEVQCRIENNRFKHAGPTAAIYQACGNPSIGAYGNMLIWNNIYDTDNYLGWYVKKTWLKHEASNFMNVESSNSNTELNINDFELIYSGYTGNWIGELYIEDCRIKVPRTPGGTTYPAKLTSSNYSINFGDYDGDGNTDIFKLENGELYTIPYDASTYGYNTDWTLIFTTGYRMKNLRFGFFDGDDKTDMIVKDGGNVYMSSGCNSSWQIVLNTGYDFIDFHFGDFLGDGQTDIFLADGSDFMISNNAQSSWSIMATSGYGSDDLLLGFFNSNTESDVFLADGSDFLVSYEGINSWATFATSGYTVLNDKLQSADFNGDNTSDILNDYHQVSLGGINSWSATTTSVYPISTFPYGNF